ncbi:hypothetical protein [Salinibacter ruber]|uniref:Uncharacterized protein n=1 Tax=Salinibacter ruber TaxID=146919 RepID=A0A9X2U9R0_9BACT|nr:hypothetical protein [Salinibacter ruber]MCS3656993.1 hypothetical protein [Salinibacter ruber]MCS3952531.1 hypothetical protein [Salinibacter ruber]MCS4118980.1 hypothetical protein [Salinibacter ruber]MCS4171288.1 hypothetical protein [Salinibacter ruber]MCS4187037.1 hypothetical protein [Salinibacter ruber]
MSSSQASWWPLTVAALTFITLVGCDVPTGNSSPSINTDTEISTPLVQEKTFTFLGGPNSEFDPLIDTTSSDFDSLFEVESSNNDISVVQEIDNFDIGNLNEALDNATGSLTFDQKTLDETFIDLKKEGFTFAGEKQIEDLNVELQVSAKADIPVRGSRVAFRKSQNNYVELGPTTIEVQNITSSPTAPGGVFDSLRFTYPDIRVEPYGEDNQLVVDFVENPCGSGPCGSNGEYERDISTLGDGFRIDLEGARIYPDKPNIDENGTVTFNIGGQVNPDLTVKDDDKISFGASTSFDNFEIREIDVDQAKPFAVAVTPNENGGDINVANDNEVRTAAFDGFEGITDRVDGLKLADVSLTFQVETANLASTDAQVYAAIQGTNETNQIYLRGTEDQNMSRGADRNVSSLPFSAAFTENGVSLQNESLIKLGVGLEEAALGETVRTPLLVDGDNSNVADFVNALPTEVRLAGQAEINTDGGGLQVRKPIALDANFSLNVPLRIKDRFVVRDTIDADLSDLNDLTDPEEDVNISTAELQVSYTNGLPLGADVKMVVFDAAGSVIETFNDGFDNENLRIQPAAKNGDGAAASSSSGTFVFTLGSTQEDLQALADGDQIRLALNMDQAGSGGGSEAIARLRADDQLTLNRVRLEADASVQTGN